MAPSPPCFQSLDRFQKYSVHRQVSLTQACRVAARLYWSMSVPTAMHMMTCKTLESCVRVSFVSPLFLHSWLWNDGAADESDPGLVLLFLVIYVVVESVLHTNMRNRASSPSHSAFIAMPRWLARALRMVRESLLSFFCS